MNALQIIQKLNLHNYNIVPANPAEIKSKIKRERPEFLVIFVDDESFLCYLTDD